MATSEDIAREAGVSQPTVSRVLNGHPNVAPQTRERVLSAITELNYAPNELARSLLSGRTKTIGVVVSDILNPFYPQLVQVLAERLAAAGYGTTLLWRVGNRTPDQLLEVLSQRLVDGMVFTAATLSSRGVLDALLPRFPVVQLNRHIPGLACDAVVTDNRAGAAQVADHLYGLGHVRMALIAGSSDTSTSTEREDGFRTRLEALGVPLSPDRIVAGDYSIESGAERMTALVRGHDPPTAVFAANDSMAVGALNAALSEGLRVPADISIVGFDDIAMAAWPICGLTTVRQPIATMAEVGVRRLLARIEDPGLAHETQWFDSELVVRRTTAPPAG